MTAPLIIDQVTCPKCGGQCWDNRLTKKGKQPDYRCKDRSCDGAIWLTPKTGSVPQAAKAPTGESFVLPVEKPKLAGIYLEATRFVLDQVVPLYEKAQIGVSDTAVGSMVATLFIAKSKEP